MLKDEAVWVRFMGALTIKNYVPYKTNTAQQDTHEQDPENNTQKRVFSSNNTFYYYLYTC